MSPSRIIGAFLIAVIMVMNGCAYNDPSRASSSFPPDSSPESASSSGNSTVPSSSSPVPGSVPSSSSPENSVTYGVIDAIEPLTGSLEGIGGSGIGIGAIIGGVVGGLLGQQIGGGTGKEAATIAGVLSGAMLGQEIEREIEKRKAQNKDGQINDGYRIRVKLDNGGTQSVGQKTVDDLHVGDRVYIKNNSVYRVYRN